MVVTAATACRQHVRNAWQNYTPLHRASLGHVSKSLIRLKKPRARHLVLKVHMTHAGGGKSCSTYSSGSPMATLFGSLKRRTWNLQRHVSSVCRRSSKQRI